MPFKPYGDIKYTTLPHSVAVFNAIRAEASETYKARVPEATQQNITDVANPLFTYSAVFNEWYSALVNRIAFTVISSKMYNNPLALFKRGMIDVGETIEEIFIDLIKAEPYYLVDDEGKTSAQDLYERRLAQVKSAFHTRNRQDKYPLSISYDDMRAAFTSWEGVDNFIRRKIEQLYASDQYDEFLLMKHVFFEAGTRGALAEVVIPDGTDKATMQEVLIAMREMVLNAGFRTNKYNYAQVSTFSNREDLVLFALPNFISRVDVVALAEAFNLEKTDFLSRVIIVDDFGGLETAGVKAILADKDWFMVFDNLFTMREAENGARLYNNMFLHHWQTISYSPFKTAIAFTTQPSEVLSVTINPSDLTLTRNNTDNPTATLLQAEVSGTGMYNPDVVWSTTIGHISDSGLLEVPNTWDGTEGVVTAISKQDGSVLDTITVRLVPNSQVSELTIREHDGTDIPSNLTVERTTDNTEVLLTAMLEGTAIRDKSVIWTTSAGEITQDGILKLNPFIDETDIKVTAYSRQDPSILHEITVSYLPERGVYSSLTPLENNLVIEFADVTPGVNVSVPLGNRGSIYNASNFDCMQILLELKTTDGNYPVFLGCTENDIVYSAYKYEVKGNMLHVPIGTTAKSIDVTASLYTNGERRKLATLNYDYLPETPTIAAATWYNTDLMISLNVQQAGNALSELKAQCGLAKAYSASHNFIRLIDIPVVAGTTTIGVVSANSHLVALYNLSLADNRIYDLLNDVPYVQISGTHQNPPITGGNSGASSGGIQGGATVNPWQPGGSDDVIIQGEKPPTGDGNGDGDGSTDNNGDNPPTPPTGGDDDEVEQWGFDFDNDTYHQEMTCLEYNLSTTNGADFTADELQYYQSFKSTFSTKDEVQIMSATLDTANNMLDIEVNEISRKVVYMCQKWVDCGLMKRKGTHIKVYLKRNTADYILLAAEKIGDPSNVVELKLRVYKGELQRYRPNDGWVLSAKIASETASSSGLDDIPTID